MRFVRPLVVASLLALTCLGTPPARAQDDPVADLLRAEADRRDAAAAQLGTLKARLDALDARLDAAMTRLTAAMEALDVALGSLRRSMDALDARLSAVESAPPAPTPVPEPTPTPLPPLPPLPPNFEWTDFTPSADTFTYYVSSSGNDANDGRTETAPLRLPGTAYSRCRDGFADRVLLRRGDTFDGTGTQEAFVCDGSLSGRSATEPLLIGTYGTGPRPVLLGGRARFLDGVKHVAVVGLAFVYVPPLVTDNAIVMNGAACEDILVEDCYLEGYPSNISLQGQGKRPRNVRIRGCVVYNSPGQGILADGVDGLVIEGCVFDHNGWREDRPGFPSNTRNHNMYLQGTCTDVTVRQTISARASSHAISLSPGGLVEDCSVFASPIGIWGHKDAVIRSNVVLDARDIEVGGARGMGIGANEVRTAEIRGNIVAHAVNGTQCHGIELAPDTGTVSVTVAENIVYRWDGAQSGLRAIGLYWSDAPHGALTVTDNAFQMGGAGLVVEHDVAGVLGAYAYSGNAYSSAAPESAWFYVAGDLPSTAAWVAASGETGATFSPVVYPDPGRTIASYMTSLGGTPTLDAFLAEARKQSRANWRVQFSAKGVNNYIREGFGMAAR